MAVSRNDGYRSSSATEARNARSSAGVHHVGSVPGSPSRTGEVAAAAALRATRPLRTASDRALWIIVCRYRTVRLDRPPPVFRFPERGSSA